MLSVLIIDNIKYAYKYGSNRSICTAIEKSRYDAHVVFSIQYVKSRASEIISLISVERHQFISPSLSKIHTQFLMTYSNLLLTNWNCLIYQQTIIDYSFWCMHIIKLTDIKKLKNNSVICTSVLVILEMWTNKTETAKSTKQNKVKISL